ncbi:MAG: hypothetical protein LLF98_07925 [Clostridium sp.]|uniref:hypothetical protein n=1 Tax=Clostridium sp. TaxID=1506 RepID=UPI0025C0A09B|nr:hypothetical protein [Clostridium sp.]MCE5221183.1 hypothetical protein [Clostridium sp.]
MNFTIEKIINELKNEFPKAYRAFGGFVEAGPLWNMCIDTIMDAELMNHIIFCNDVLKMPPVKVFLLANESDFDITDYERKFLGAFWGFIFKFVFKYNNQKSTSISTKGIKSATYFYECESKIKVVNEE